MKVVFSLTGTGVTLARNRSGSKSCKKWKPVESQRSCWIHQQYFTYVSCILSYISLRVQMSPCMNCLHLHSASRAKPRNEQRIGWFVEVFWSKPTSGTNSSYLGYLVSQQLKTTWDWFKVRAPCWKRHQIIAGCCCFVQVVIYVTTSCHNFLDYCSLFLR